MKKISLLIFPALFFALTLNAQTFVQQGSEQNNTATGINPNIEYSCNENDVITDSNSSYGNTSRGTCGEESFSNIPTNSSSSYKTRTWTGNNSIGWKATNGRTDQKLNGIKAIAIKGRGILSNTTAVSGGMGTLTFDYARVFSGNSTLKVFVNGTQYGGNISVSSTSSTTASIEVNLAGDISLELKNVTKKKRTLINNLSWTCYSSAVACPHTITSIAPTLGPVGTMVTINGTGFTSSTTAKIGSLNMPVTFVSATKIKVEVPTDAQTGTIELTEDGCSINSETFTIIGESGCSNLTDLIISEVYDSPGGSLWYLELFNPTDSDIDLATADYKIKRYGDYYNSNHDNIFVLEGTVKAHSVLTIKSSGTGTSCSDVAFVSGGLTSGINGNDKLILTKSGTPVDEVRCPSNAGYTVKRKSTATGPTTTHNSSDWEVLSYSCDDLGTFETSGGSAPTVDDIISLQDCQIDYSVEITEGTSYPANDMDYKWYFNDGVSSTWSVVNSTNLPNLNIGGATGTNLVIGSGASQVSEIDEHQFYCEATEAGSCKNVSKANTFKQIIRPVFRSKQSGNWKSADTWEMSDDLGSSTFTAACTYPTNLNSTNVIIRSGHTITIQEDPNITPDIEEKDITIESEGFLILAKNAEMQIDNGLTGADFIINGTFTDASSNGGGNGITFNEGATWQISTDATIVKTHNSSATVYRDNYEGGIENIPAGANWIYRHDGTGSLVIANSCSDKPMYYPNLTFETTQANYSFNSINEVFTGSQNKVTIKGDLIVGTNNSHTVTVFNNNFNTESMLILGDLYIAQGSKLTNERYTVPNGNYDKTWREGAGFELKGDVYIQGGTLDVTHAAPSSQSSSGRVAPGSEGVIFSSSASQAIIGETSSSFQTNDLTINNSNNIETLDIDLEVNDELIFVDGKIITSDKVWIKNTSSDAIVNGATSGKTKYVEGKLQWTTVANKTYSFPIGYTSKGVQCFKISPKQGGGEILGYLETNNSSPLRNYAYCDLEKHPGSGTGVYVGNGVTGTDGILDRVEFDLASPLQWNVTNPGNGITEYDIEVVANGEQDISPVTSANNQKIRYLLKNGKPGNDDVEIITAEPSFPDEGFKACPNGYVLEGMTGFSKFTINGASSGNAILPVSLVYYQAKLNKNSEVLNTWVTATEINNDYFTVERSADGKLFKAIAKIEGAINSVQSNSYQFTDKNPLKGYSYYRLKQTDFDGTISYSQVVSVFNKAGGGVQWFSVYPSPFEQYLKIDVVCNENVQAIIYDLGGRFVYSESFSENTSLNLQTLNSGTYILKLISAQNTEIVKIVKK